MCSILFLKAGERVLVCKLHIAQLHAAQGGLDLYLTSNGHLAISHPVYNFLRTCMFQAMPPTERLEHMTLHDLAAKMQARALHVGAGEQTVGMSLARA